MQVTTELNGMFYYSILPIIFFIIILITIIIINKIKNKKVKDNVLTINNITKDIPSIKDSYIKQLDNLEKRFTNKTINNRKAFQELSIILRNFIYEIKGIKIQNFSLSEIKRMNMPLVHELIEEYYEPEFARISKKDVKEYLSKTREVIKKWQ